MTPTAPPGRDESETPAATAPATAATDPEPRTDQHPAIAQPPAPVADEKGSLDRGVFTVSAVLALAFVAWGFLSPTGLGSASGSALTWIEANLGWLFVTLASAFVVYVLWLAARKYGRIPLGRDDEAPEFRTVSWIAMMFNAGMGIGLMFYGVAEPLAHYVSPPPRTVQAQTPEAIRTAMATTLFHWTLHPWAIYAVVGLPIAYGTFRRGRRQLISSAFEPLSAGAAPRVRPAGSSTSWPSSPRCSARRPRWASARCRSAAAWRSWAGPGTSATASWSASSRCSPPPSSPPRSPASARASSGCPT